MDTRLSEFAEREYGFGAGTGHVLLFFTEIGLLVLVLLILPILLAQRDFRTHCLDLGITIPPSSTLLLLLLSVLGILGVLRVGYIGGSRLCDWLCNSSRYQNPWCVALCGVLISVLVGVVFLMWVSYGKLIKQLQTMAMQYFGTMFSSLTPVVGLVIVSLTLTACPYLAISEHYWLHADHLFLFQGNDDAGMSPFETRLVYDIEQQIVKAGSDVQGVNGTR